MHNPNSTTPEHKIVIGQVARYSPESGKYFVKFPGMTADPKVGYPAQLVSPTPFTDGGGLKSVPKVPIDTPCLLYNASKRWIIIGFLSPEGAVVNDTHFETRTTEPGETFIMHNTGARMGFAASGSAMMWASNVMNMILNPVIAQMSAFFKNMFINWFGGFISYVYDDEKKTSKFTLQIKKDLDLAAITPGTIQKDRITMRLGAFDDNSHIADVSVLQEFDVAKKAAYSATAKLGKQKDGTWFDLLSTASTTTSDTTLALKVNTSGKLELTSQAKDESTSVVLTMDPTASNVIQLAVNKDKAIITIDATGNVTIKTAEDAKIKLGGTGMEQPLVTEAWVNTIFKNHMHASASPGPPSPPIPIPPVPTTADAKSNFLTHTTLAE